jgi:hypothetical protein
MSGVLAGRIACGAANSELRILSFFTFGARSTSWLSVLSRTAASLYRDIILTVETDGICKVNGRIPKKIVLRVAAPGSFVFFLEAFVLTKPEFHSFVCGLAHPANNFLSGHAFFD